MMADEQLNEIKATAEAAAVALEKMKESGLESLIKYADALLDIEELKAENAKRQAMMMDLKGKYNRLEAENAKLRALLRRVNEQAKYLFDEWGGLDTKITHVRQSKHLQQLLDDCREAVE